MLSEDKYIEDIDAHGTAADTWGGGVQSQGM